MCLPQYLNDQAGLRIIRLCENIFTACETLFEKSIGFYYRVYLQQLLYFRWFTISTDGRQENCEPTSAGIQNA